MNLNEITAQHKVISFSKLSLSLKTLSLLILLLASYFGYIKYTSYKNEYSQTLAIISAPKINDIYFLDFRLISDKIRPKDKYRIAKVVDITGDIVTLVYGVYFYQYQHAAINSIQYGQLSYKDYFEPKRYDTPLSTINSMYKNGAIYLAKRPTGNKLYGNLVGPEQVKQSASRFIYGKKENIKGEALLTESYSEINFKHAFELFQQSSSLGYAAGQVNLAEMYINGGYIEKNLKQALYWLKQAALQSNKSAILKYGIVCKQVSDCNLADFYQKLTSAGVNIKVRKIDFKLSN